MKLRLLSLLLLVSACYGQNGPTKPSVTLTWGQSPTVGVTANCVYRGTVSGTYTLPALFCSTAPITSYNDPSVLRGQTYHYAVTAKAGATEGAYSNDVQTVIPQAPSAPTLNTAPVITESLKRRPSIELEARVEWTKQ